MRATTRYIPSPHGTNPAWSIAMVPLATVFVVSPADAVASRSPGVQPLALRSASSAIATRTMQIERALFITVSPGCLRKPHALFQRAGGCSCAVAAIVSRGALWTMRGPPGLTEARELVTCQAGALNVHRMIPKVSRAPVWISTSVLGSTCLPLTYVKLLVLKISTYHLSRLAWNLPCLRHRYLASDRLETSTSPARPM